MSNDKKVEEARVRPMTQEEKEEMFGASATNIVEDECHDMGTCSVPEPKWADDYEMIRSDIVKLAVRHNLSTGELIEVVFRKLHMDFTYNQIPCGKFK